MAKAAMVKKQCRGRRDGNNGRGRAMGWAPGSVSGNPANPREPRVGGTWPTRRSWAERISVNHGVALRTGAKDGLKRFEAKLLIAHCETP